jgi:hypothetical protein
MEGFSRRRGTETQRQRIISHASVQLSAGLLCFVLACRGDGGGDAALHERYRRELTSAFVWGGALSQSQSSLESPSCMARITSPPTDTVWTASYLIVQWRLCLMEEMSAGLIIIRFDGQEMMRGPPSTTRFTIHGIADGWHTIDLVATDEQGLTLDLGPHMNLRFRAQRGESLLGSMAKRVEAGDFGRIDAANTGRTDGPESRTHETEAPCAHDQNFTLVTAAINIGRRHGNISFEDDYIGNLRHILSLRCPVVIHLQEQYVPMLEPFLHGRAMIRIKDIGDLESFKHAAAVDALRTSSSWAGNKKAYNPAKMKHYNALVMSKLYWLAEVAQEDPFETETFLWIDAGLCVRFVTPPLQLADVVHASAGHVSRDGGGDVAVERFLAYAMAYSYAEGGDIHGFPQEAHLRFSGRAATHLLRGNILGGSARAVQAMVAEYDRVLEQTLREHVMGTEESAMTVTCARSPLLCNVISVSENHLDTEMPCNMFLRFSASGPRVTLLFPRPRSSLLLHPEALLMSVKVTNFIPGTDGALCVTWSGGRTCSNSRDSCVGESETHTGRETNMRHRDTHVGSEAHAGNETHADAQSISERSIGQPLIGQPSSGYRCTLAIAGLEPGELELRAELLGHDGLPLASSGPPTEVSVALATSDTMNHGGDMFDTRGALGSYLAEHAFAGAGLVVGDVRAGAEDLQYIAKELSLSAGYAGKISIQSWESRTCADLDGGQGGGTCFRTQGARGQGGEKGASGGEGRGGGGGGGAEGDSWEEAAAKGKYDFVYLSPPLNGSGFRVQGSGFRVQGSGFRVQGLGLGCCGA